MAKFVVLTNIAMQKVRFTLWMDEDVLNAARGRAGESGVTPSRVIADAARTILIDNPQNAEARVLVAVERVFALIQRIDRRRSFDQQVLKEMVGLMVQSFFNHTPAIPEKDKKAALHSGKARFNRFLDTLATHLRSGQSIMNDLPAPVEPTSSDTSAPIPQPRSADLLSSPAKNRVPGKAPEAGEQKAGESLKSPEPPAEKPSSTSNSSKWNLFGFKES
jgi:hypothetical protein